LISSSCSSSSLFFFSLLIPRPPISTLFPYTTLSDLTPSMMPCNSSVAAEWFPESRWSGSTARFARCASTKAPVRSKSWLSPRNRSEEHTSELQSRENLVCRLLLEKKKKKKKRQNKDM